MSRRISFSDTLRNIASGGPRTQHLELTLKFGPQFDGLPPLTFYATFPSVLHCDFELFSQLLTDSLDATPYVRVSSSRPVNQLPLF